LVTVLYQDIGDTLREKIQFRERIHSFIRL